MVFQRGADDLVGEHVTFLDHFAGIDRLDRVVVRTEGKVAAGAVKIRGTQGFAECICIRWAGAFQSRQQQVGCVKALAGIEAGQTPILILDEPSSALDADTEKEVVGSLRAALAGRTLIVITHRPEALRLADRVVELGDGGRVLSDDGGGFEFDPASSRAAPA